MKNLFNAANIIKEANWTIHALCISLDLILSICSYIYVSSYVSKDSSSENVA